MSTPALRLLADEGCDFAIPAEDVWGGWNNSAIGEIFAGNMGTAGKARQGKRIKPSCSAS